MFLGLWLKARHEENRLREVLPDYGAYARETAALIPFLL
jgi:protein-S-isoprenylcysteine O-methyltransferase Ste14